MEQTNTTDVANVSRDHGLWGEQVASAYLEKNGYEIIARNVRPCKWDKRLELDIVARDCDENILVFIEVKQHKSHSDYENRLRSITMRKKRLLRLACRAWLAKNHWQGSYRFDVIEIFGSPEMKNPIHIDHILRVQLFANEEHFINWSE